MSMYASYVERLNLIVSVIKRFVVNVANTLMNVNVIILKKFIVSIVVNIIYKEIVNLCVRIVEDISQIVHVSNYYLQLFKIV